jgi:di/tricarboxylate transporter
MLPLGTALSNSGGIDFLTARLVDTAGHLGPHAVLLGIYLVTTLLGQVMSNTATALILTPLAIKAAQLLQVAPEPLLMGVAFGASTAFLTPIASPVNTLVVAPGNYQFLDFLKVGLPLHLMASTICVLVIPLAFPFALKA